MEIEVWHIWIIIAIFLFILEVFAPTFLMACLALGCIAAGISSFFDYGIKIQLLSFSIGTLIGFFGIRPFMLKYAHRNSGTVKTNLEALVGKVGKVTVTIDSSQNQGRIIVEGEDWRAETENNVIINEGERAEVLKVNSTILIVKQTNKS